MQAIFDDAKQCEDIRRLVKEILEKTKSASGVLSALRQDLRDTKPNRLIERIMPILIDFVFRLDDAIEG